jgi:hypothetical protein
MEFKDLWDLESAMKIITHETVDGKLWAEAVKWLILHGPAEIRQVLLDASSIATNASFPELAPSHYTADGQPCYDIKELAKSLNITESEVRQFLQENEKEFFELHIHDSADKVTVH